MAALFQRALADLLGVAEREASDSILAEAAQLAAGLGIGVHTLSLRRASLVGYLLNWRLSDADLIAIGAGSGGDEQSPGPKFTRAHRPLCG